MNWLVEVLRDQRGRHVDGNVYKACQCDFAYNSNHMEGSTLTHDQTVQVFDRGTFAGTAKVDDIVEARNHFNAFDHVVDTFDEPAYRRLPQGPAWDFEARHLGRRQPDHGRGRLQAREQRDRGRRTIHEGREPKGRAATDVGALLGLRAICKGPSRHTRLPREDGAHPPVLGRERQGRAPCHVQGVPEVRPDALHHHGRPARVLPARHTRVGQGRWLPVRHVRACAGPLCGRIPAARARVVGAHAGGAAEGQPNGSEAGA